MKRTTEYNINWSGRIEDREFSNILFSELTVRNTEIKRSKFHNVHFKNCYLGFNSTYSDCTFIDCKFYGKYSSLGCPASYHSCRFINCQFIGIDLFSGQHFNNCQFSGLMKNPILRDQHPSTDHSETVFESCDLKDLVFDNVSVYGNEVFRNCILPVEGLRLFDNTNDSLLERAQRICSEIDSEDKIESEVIFRKTTKHGQNPIILDEPFLHSFFKTEKSRQIFEQIVKGFELKELKSGS